MLKISNYFEDELFSKGCGPRPEDFDGLKSFIDRLTGIENLIIHCGAGESRSPAIAMAVTEYIEKNGGKAVICSKIKDYNSRVLKLAKSELKLHDEKRTFWAIITSVFCYSICIHNSYFIEISTDSPSPTFCMLFLSYQTRWNSSGSFFMLYFLRDVQMQFDELLLLKRHQQFPVCEYKKATNQADSGSINENLTKTSLQTQIDNIIKKREPETRLQTWKYCQKFLWLMILTTKNSIHIVKSHSIATKVQVFISKRETMTRETC